MSADTYTVYVAVEVDRTRLHELAERAEEGHDELQTFVGKHVVNAQADVAFKVSELLSALAPVPGDQPSPIIADKRHTDAPLLRQPGEL